MCYSLIVYAMLTFYIFLLNILNILLIILYPVIDFKNGIYKFYYIPGFVGECVGKFALKINVSPT